VSTPSLPDYPRLPAAEVAKNKAARARRRLADHAAGVHVTKPSTLCPECKAA